MYIGFVGAKLHPSLSATQLSQGPLESKAAIAEMGAMDATNKRTILIRACNSVAHLTAVTLAAYLIWGIEWPWYISLPVAFFGSALIGGILRVALAER